MNHHQDPTWMTRVVRVVTRYGHRGSMHGVEVTQTGEDTPLGFIVHHSHTPPSFGDGWLPAALAQHDPRAVAIVEAVDATYTVEVVGEVTQ